MIKKKLLLVQALLIAVLLIACSGSSRLASGNGTTLELGSGSVSIDSEIELSLVATDIPEPGLAGFSITITFDPALLEVSEVRPGDSPWTDNTVNLNRESGLIRILNAKATGTTGTLSLARIVMRPVGVTGQTMVEIRDATLGDADLQQIPVSFSPGEVTVIAATPTGEVPSTPTSTATPQSSTPTPTAVSTATPVATPTGTPPGPVTEAELFNTKATPEFLNIFEGESRQLSIEFADESSNSEITWSLVAQDDVSGLAFAEPFDWFGAHGATIPGADANTVWWDAGTWDARTDTAHNAVSVAPEGNHIDIHKGFENLEDGNPNDDLLFLGGNGSPGVAIMRLNFEGIASGRLRNPMLISADQPGVVEFWAPKFATTGHWWEVSISPTDQVISGEFTAVPSPGEPFDRKQGPGNSPPEDSINFLVIGRNDAPHKTEWASQIGITRAIDGKREDLVGPSFPTDPTRQMEMFKWRIVYMPDSITVAADFDLDGFTEPLETFDVSVPWDEVYVHLVGVAYQASKHPQDESNQGQVKLIPWKNVTIGPLKYARTAVFPEQTGLLRTPILEGWSSFDLRDNQRFGVVNGIPQPNAEQFHKHTTLAFCSDEDVFGCSESENQFELNFTLSESDLADIGRAQFTYDIRGTGTAMISLNGDLAVPMPQATTVEGAAREHWVRRSVDLSPEQLQEGQNTVRITMLGNVQFDRMEVEVAYTQPASKAGEMDMGVISANGQYDAPAEVERPVTVFAIATNGRTGHAVAVVPVTVRPRKMEPLTLPSASSGPGFGTIALFTLLGVSAAAAIGGGLFWWMRNGPGVTSAYATGESLRGSGHVTRIRPASAPTL